MTAFQTRIVAFLFCLLCLTVLLFRLELFLRTDTGVLLAKIYIPLTLAACAVCLGKFWQKKRGTHWCFTLLLLAEVALYTELRLLAAGSQQPAVVLKYARLYHGWYGNRSILSVPGMTAYDPALFYTLQPGAYRFSRLEYSNFFNINSLGFRQSAPTADTPTVAFLGDSFTMGIGVEQDETFVALASRHLGLPSLNLGVSSYGTARQLRSFEQLRPGCRLVVWQHCDNDAEENRQFLANGRQLEVSSPETLAAKQREARMWSGYFPLKYTFAALHFLAVRVHGRLDVAKPRIPAFSKEQAMQDFIAIVQQMQTIFSGPVVVWHASHWQPDAAWEALFAQQLQAAGLADVHLLPVAEGLTTADFYPLDGHLNAAGHRKVANALIAFLLERQMTGPVE